MAALGQEVKACALGQASAALMGAHAIGRTAGELADARDALAAFLAGRRDDPGDWPGLGVFADARRFTRAPRRRSCSPSRPRPRPPRWRAGRADAAEAADAATLVLRDGVILLGVALVFVLLFRRLGLGAMLGYLVAGALVGPQGSA